MKRLTGRAPDGTAYLYNMGGTNAAIDRLAAYEDTGMEPDEISIRRWIPVTESEAATGGGGRVKQHVLKLSEEFADAVLHREKTFEVRKNDRGFQKGDEVKFIVVDNLGLYRVHPLEDMAFRITYVLSGWHIDPEYVVFSIVPAALGGGEDG